MEFMVLALLEKLPNFCDLNLKNSLAVLTAKQLQIEKSPSAATAANIQSVWYRSIFGNLNPAQCLFEVGIGRRYSIYTIANLLKSVALSLITMPALLAKTLFNVFLLFQSVILRKNNTSDHTYQLSQEASYLLKAAAIILSGSILGIGRLVTFIFSDSYQFFKEKQFKKMGARSCFLVIDVQNDFLEGGRLGVKKSQAIVPVINQIINRIKDDPKWDIAATLDWHPLSHKSFALYSNRTPFSTITLGEVKNQTVWPIHCVQNSEGAQFATGLDVSQFDYVVRKGLAEFTDSYSGFQDNMPAGDQRVIDTTSLNETLHSRNIDTLVMAGLAKDFCVKFTALDARKRGYNVVLIDDASAGLDEQCLAAKAELKKAGVSILTSEEYFRTKSQI